MHHRACHGGRLRLVSVRLKIPRFARTALIVRSSRQEPAGFSTGTLDNRSAHHGKRDGGNTIPMSPSLQQLTSVSAELLKTLPDEHHW